MTAAATTLAGLGLLLGLAGAPATAAPDLDALREQVRQAETAFAGTMAARDHAAFSGWLSEQALFFDGRQWLRGKAAVAAAWKAYFDGAQAPFSWAPDQVEVLDDGTLAQTTGPVRNPAGQRVGRFISVWRQESPGQWRIVFDRGSPLSEAEKQQP